MKAPSLLAVALVAAAPVALATGVSPAAAASKKAKKPTITLVTPMRLTVGKTLTIKGKNFSKSKGGNKVIIEGAKGRLVIVKPSRFSSTKLTIKVPSSAERILTPKDGAGTPTRVHLRVVTKAYGVRSGLRQSPVVVSARSAPAKGSDPVPAPAPKTGASGGSAGNSVAVPAACGTGTDWDNDLLANTVELQYGLNPCSADTDGDGAGDGWEYYSAKDLNVAAVPYPGRKPYPNPLDGSDAGIDFDGDSLTLGEEYTAWVATGKQFDAANPSSPLGYSDGTKTSRPTVVPPTPLFRSASLGQSYTPPSYPSVYDTNGNGQYSDDERDADADGLNNFIETHGPGTFSWWSAVLAREQVEAWPGTDPSVNYSYFGAFTRRPFANTEFTVADTDGDTLLDGEDDQDNDDIPNTTEMYNPGGTVTIGGQARRKNAFNPCAPDIDSRTCPTYFPVN